MGYCLISVSLLLLYTAVTTAQTTWQCNFDTNLCGMTQSTAEPTEFDWTRTNTSTPSGNTGPGADHTTGSGYFMFIEATNTNALDYADLDTPVFNRGSYCLRFWYHMYGHHIGSLHVSVLTNSDSSLQWFRDKEGTGGIDEWRLGEANITATTSATFRIRFRGIRGGEAPGQPFGDIGLDDITLERCDGVTTTTTTTTTTTKAPTTKVTTPTTTTKATTPSTTTASTTSTTRSTTQNTGTALNATVDDDTTNTEKSVGSQTNTTQSPSTTAAPPTPKASGLEEELWGLEGTYWIIILSVAGFVILILLLVIVCQACALSHAKTTTAHITRRTGDFDNFDGYTKYSGAGNGNGTAGNGTSSAPGYINAYENGAYTNDP